MWSGTRRDEIVEIRGETWIVSGRSVYDGCAILRLEGRGPGNFGRVFRIVEPFDRVRPIEPARLPRLRRDAVLRHALAAVANQRPAAGLWTAAAAAIDLLPFQWAPALSVLDGRTRVLLADEVGLGKTIQAGLIVAELQARGLVDRALVLVPAGLRETWAREFRERLNLESRVVDHAEIAQLTACWPLAANPWARRGVTIASIDYVKRAEVLAAIADVPLDILIVDEAHHLTPGSDRGAAVEHVASRAQWVVLVSATPHSGDERAFDYLSNLGRAGDAMTMFRRHRHEAGRADPRRRHLLAVTPSAAEFELLAGVEDYASSIWRSRGDRDPNVRLVACTLARRAASSATAIGRTLARRLALLSGHDDPSPRQARLPWEDIDDGDADETADELARPGLDDPLEERRLLERLIDRARSAEARSSKIARLVRLIERVGEPIVVFTEYRDTLDAIGSALRGRHAFATIHGGLVSADRQRSVDRFNAGEVRILIATDTGGEGLNLHHRCRLVVTLELPWNPRRLEQRVGRVDRIGQERRVHAIHLFHRRTIEDLVLARLESRRILAERRLATAGRSPVAGEEAARLSAARRALAIADRSRHGAGWASPKGRWRTSRRLIAVYDVELTDSSGHALQRTSVGLSIDARGQTAIEDHDDLVRNAALDPSDGLRQFAAANLSRIDHIRASLSTGSSTLHQTSLFDRRAEQVAAVHAETRRRLDDHFASRAARLRGWINGELHTRVRLIAVWPVSGGT